MRLTRLILASSLACLLLAIPSRSQTSPKSEPDVFFSVPPADAPELAPRGQYAVGVRTVEVKNPGQIDILNFDKATGKAPVYDRPLPLEIWYPATIPDGKQERTVYEMALPGDAPASSGGARTFAVLGKALRDAPPIRGKAFPLVIVSHGYPELGLSSEENDRAVEAGFVTLQNYETGIKSRARRTLDQLEREDRIGIVMLARPYHHDPGLNHEILDEFQKLGYPIFSQNTLPTDEDLLERLFGDEVRAGVTSHPLDITDA